MSSIFPFRSLGIRNWLCPDIYLFSDWWKFFSCFSFLWGLTSLDHDTIAHSIEIVTNDRDAWTEPRYRKARGLHVLLTWWAPPPDYIILYRAGPRSSPVRVLLLHCSTSSEAEKTQILLWPRNTGYHLLPWKKGHVYGMSHFSFSFSFSSKITYKSRREYKEEESMSGTCHFQCCKQDLLVIIGKKWRSMDVRDDNEWWNGDHRTKWFEPLAYCTTPSMGLRWRV